MTIICDIGGTYIRCAQEQSGQPVHIRKYNVAAFSNLSAALERYQADTSLTERGALRLAYAGYHGGDLETLYGSESWLNPADLKSAGWNIETALNDFEAAAWALPHYKSSELTAFKGDAQQGTLCLMGPGTGLGLAFVRDGDVHITTGGQMPIACASDEQFAVIKEICADAPMVFESLVSGPGLQKLRMLKNEGDALRLFHEFFGLCAANAVITGHALDGLYLSGGVMESLMADGLFDFALFEKWFCLKGVPATEEALGTIPVFHVKDPYPALKGLVHA